MAKAMALKQTCQQLRQKRPVRIIFDLSKTTFIDSSVIGVLVSSLQTTAELGVELVLWSVHPPVMETLFAAGLDRLVVIDSETKAITLADSHQLEDRQPTNYPSVRSWIKQFVDKISPT
jgi:anti-anti-sigma factor